MKSYQNLFLTVVYSKRIWLCVIILALISSGCKEDEDDEKPRVFIEEPYENFNISSVDTILVHARISDNEQITSIEVELVDLDFAPMVGKQVFQASGSDVNFVIEYILDAPLLNSGAYYIVVRANDGRNVGSGFRKVSLTAIPRALERRVVVTSGSNNVKIFSQQAGESWVERINLYYDFAGADLNFRQDLLGIAGGEIGDALFYNTVEFEVEQSVPGLGTQSMPYFRGLRYDEASEIFMLLLEEPRLRLFDKNAAGITGFPLQPNQRPHDAFAANNRLYVLERPVSTPNYSLNVYAQPGLFLASLAVEGPVKGVFRKSDDEVYVWVQAPETVQLKILNTNTNLMSEPYERQDEVLNDMVQVGPDAFVIGTSAGLYRYSYGNGGTLILNEGFVAEKLFYEDMGGIIYASSGNVLFQLSPTGTVLNEENFTGTIEFVGFDYNR